MENLLRLQEANQRQQSMIEPAKEEEAAEPSSLLAEKKSASFLILPNGVKRP